MEHHYYFKKEERLCGQTHIDALFNQGKSFISYPFRCVYLIGTKENTIPCVLISVSKKNFKRANKRNLIKRRIRESYRINKDNILPILEEKKLSIDLALLFIGSKIPSFQETDYYLKKIIHSLSKQLS